MNSCGCARSFKVDWASVCVVTVLAYPPLFVDVCTVFVVRGVGLGRVVEV